MSAIDSPRESCSSSPRRTIGVPPSSATPTSKEIRVRVEGLSKTSAMLRPASASAPAPLARPGFQLGGAVEQLAELERAQLFAGEEISLQAADTRAVRVHRHQLEPLPRARLPARPGAAHLALAAAADQGAQRDPHPGQPRPQRRVRGDAGGLASGTWRCCRSARRASPSRSPGQRRRGPPGAHLAQLAGAVRRLAAALNPDLIASGEGGSNLTLVRAAGALGGIVERRELAIHEGRPERRAMAFTRTASGVCVANLHATNDIPEARRRGRAARGRGGDRVGGRRAAALRRRPQPATGPEPGDLRRARASASASPGRRRPTRSTTSSSAASRRSSPRPLAR